MKAITPEGATKDIADHTIYIKIKLSGFLQTLRSWLSYLQDNPAMVVTVILIPVFGFLGKQYFDRKK
ncbi:MAG: hypothetical protein Q8S18_09900 [Bacteroidales bacterium]|nr:hypothetical protein [Bacteroidales bacterium]